MRGKLLVEQQRQPLGRITPACAGKTLSGSSWRFSPRDHPRVCGENALDARACPQCVGSPPRVRGKPDATPYRSESDRITPACAGKTGAEGGRAGGGEDHPRVCGENQDRPLPLPAREGSPPRVRGKRAWQECIDDSYRITPACAGKTISETLGRDAKEDHPRVCGENKAEDFLINRKAGSPPRVRGKRFVVPLKSMFFRITPACAGKTYKRGGVELPSEDHPRVCGENQILCLRHTIGTGSPPRVRGKRSGCSGRVSQWGITPACAGKTLRKWRISVVDPSPQPRSSLTSRRADASIGSQRAPCAAPV